MCNLGWVVGSFVTSKTGWKTSEISNFPNRREWELLNGRELEDEVESGREGMILLMMSLKVLTIFVDL